MKPSSLFKNNFWLFFPYLLLLLVCGYFLLSFSKADIHIWINQHNSPFADTFFKYASSMGEGWVIAPVCIVLLFIRFRYALMAIASSILAPLLTQFLKRVVWPDSPRPKIFFQSIYDLHFVEGVHLHSSHSFPSGHTTGAFALFMVLALISKKPFWKVLFLLLACLTAYSRMYLSQHFLIDVSVGSLVGSLTALFCYVCLVRCCRPSLDKSLSICVK